MTQRGDDVSNICWFLSQGLCGGASAEGCCESALSDLNVMDGNSIKAIVLQASQGVGMLAGPEVRSRAFELSKKSPRVANFYVAFGTFVGI
jgi:hypothetical protein